MSFFYKEYFSALTILNSKKIKSKKLKNFVYYINRLYRIIYKFLNSFHLNYLTMKFFHSGFLSFLFVVLIVFFGLCCLGKGFFGHIKFILFFGNLTYLIFLLTYFCLKIDGEINREIHWFFIQNFFIIFTIYYFTYYQSWWFKIN